MADLQKTGIELLAEGASKFVSDVEGANRVMGNMAGSAQQGGDAINVLGEIATGALRRIGELALDGVMKLGSSLMDFVGDAMEGEKLLARLTTVITATGGAAGLTVEAAQGLADKFKLLAGGSDETVLAIEEMALRMGTVSAEQMPEFIQTTLDLAAATGTDSVTAARLMAQAYDDPVSAMARFNKMGIRFDTDLQEQIKTLIKSGDTAGAYALMMERVGEATSGAAAGQANTLAGQVGIMQERMADAGKAIGEALLPILKTLFDEVIAPALPIVEQFAGSISSFITQATTGINPLNLLKQAFIDFQPTLQPLIDAVMNVGLSFQTTFPTMKSTAADMVTFVQNLFASMSPTLIANVSTMLNQIAIFWTAHGAQIMAVVDVAFKIISATIGGALTLISGIIAAYMQIVNGDWTGAWQTIQDTLTTFLQMALDVVGVDLDQFTAIWRSNWEMAVLIITTVWKNIQDSVTAFGVEILIKFNDIVAKIQAAFDYRKWVALGVSIIGGIGDGIRSMVNSIAEQAAKAAQAVVDRVKGVFGIQSPSKVMMEVGFNLMSGMARGINLSSFLPQAAMQQAIMPPASAASIYNSSSITNNWNYAPSYGSAPPQPSADFAIMQVMTA